MQFAVAEKWEDQGLRESIPAILAWMDPDRFLKRLTDAIDKMPPPPFVMSAKARAEKLIAVETELLLCEREEEALIERVEEGEGPPIMRRLNADPRAVLCLGINRGPKKAERVRADEPESRGKSAA